MSLSLVPALRLDAQGVAEAPPRGAALEEVQDGSSETVSRDEGGRPGARAEARDLEPSWVRDSFFAPPALGIGRARLSVSSPVFYDAGSFLGLRSASPDNATFKAGDFYLKVGSVSGSVLHSDNVDLSPTQPEAGTISILRLGMVALYQFTENLQLAVGGALVYLPQEGKAGVSGFGIQDPLYAFATRPIFEARLAYELQAGEWSVRLVDEFRIIAALPAPEGIGFEFREESAAGQYAFRDPFRPVGIEDSFVLKENRTGASLSRLLPTETRLTVGGGRSYYWYDGAFSSPYPGRRDTGYVALDSELQDLRFKPYSLYKIDRYDLGEYDNQQVRGGLRGPASENVALLGDVGYFWQDGSGQEGVLWDAQVQHVVSPRLRHRASFGRYVTEPFGNVEERVMYSARQQLSSVISLGLSAHSSRFSLLDRARTQGTQRGVNLGVRGEVLPEGGVEVGGGWLREGYEAQAVGSRDTWLARVRLRYRSLEAECVYRFLVGQAPGPASEHRENLVSLTLLKSF